MAFGNQNQSGFNNASQIFANIVKLIGPNAIIIGPNFYIDRTGAFFYDQNITIGVPSTGAGHLIGSGFVAPFTGAPPVFDRFGNSILPEFCTYNNTGGSGSLTSLIVAINLSVGDLAVRTAPQYNQTFNNTYTTLELGGSVLGVFNLNTVADGDLALTCGLNTDPKNRFQFDDNGFMQWGTGAVAPDTQLLRSGVNTLQTAGGIVSNRLTSGGAFGAQLTTDSFLRYFVDNNGQIAWGPGTAATDCTLFRSSGGTMEFGQSLVVGNSLQVLVNTILGFMSTTQASIAISGSAPGAIAGSVEVVGSNSGLLFTVAPSGLGQFASGSSLADFTHTVVTGTATTVIGKSYSIPAADAQVGDVYEWDLQLFGTQGSTQQALAIGFQVAGSHINGFSFPVAFAAASAAFQVKAKLTLTIVTTGSGGTFYYAIEGVGGSTGAKTAVMAASGATAGTAINTTIANSVQFDASWGSTTGAPTMTLLATNMRKVS